MATTPVEVGRSGRVAREYVELHPRSCLCGGIAYLGTSPFGVRPCDHERGSIVRVIVDARDWRSAGRPPSEESYRETRIAAVRIPACGAGTGAGSPRLAPDRR